jgi:hypothetical protein
MFLEIDSIMLSPTVNSIIKDNYDRYISQYPHTTKAEKKILSLLSRCRTGDLGYRVEQCDTCGYTVILNNSCRNRHCPLCQNMKKEQWIMERKKEVLPFTYFHIVFTLPDQLNALVWRNKRILYNLLFFIAKETLLSVSADEKYFGADIGFFSILHTWGQKLNLHPHVHCVVPGGGYSKKKQQWKHAPGNYFVPVDVLKNRFRSRFLVALKKLYAKGSLYCEHTVYTDQKYFQQLIDKLFETEWVVYLKESFANSDSVIEYLSRYTHKIAISNHRIISAGKNTVSFSYRDYKDNNKKKVMTLDTLKFMRMFCLHILPFRFVRIRYYGLLAHRNKTEALAACRKFYGQLTNNFAETLTWQEVYLKKTGKDLCKCPVCESGIMKTIMITQYRMIFNSS